MTTIHFVTLSDRPALSNITQSTLRKYCEQHGYGLSTFTSSLDSARHIAWSKLKALREVMEVKSADYYVWIDDDILITRPEVDIMQFVREFNFDGLETKSIMVSADTLVLLNSGLMVLKPYAFEFLALLWDMPLSKSDTLGKTLHDANWEQDCIIDYVTSREGNGDTDHEILIVPYKRLQAFARIGYDEPEHTKWDPSVFSAHVSGMPMQDRMACLHKVLSKLGE